MRTATSPSRNPLGRELLRTLLGRCDDPETADQLRAALAAETAGVQEIEALLARLVTEQVLDRVSARAVSLILSGQLDLRDLKQLLPPRRVRARRGGAEAGESPRPERPVLAPGTPAGRCVIGPQLYSGPNCDVYQGTHAGLNCTVVVKVAGPGLAAEQLRNEVAVLSVVADRHVVRLWDAGTVHGAPFLATEYLPTNGLDRLRATGPIPPAEGLRLLRDFASGLRAAFRAGYTHGDVKPGNLLLDAKGVGKVADFGLARRRGETQAQPLEPLAGTWPYAAPERFAGYADHRADLYSLALTTYHLLTGTPPVTGRTYRECLQAHRELALEPLHWHLTGISREASQLLLRMASRDPDQRPNDYDEVIAVLDRLAGCPATPVPDPDPGDPA